MLFLADQELLDRAMLKAKFRAESMRASKEQAIGESSEVYRYGSTAVIPVTGPLFYKYDIWAWLSEGTSYTGIKRKLAAAVADPQVEKIVLVFDTPGGEVTGVNELAKYIRSIKKQTVAMVDPCAASAGLWLASQCQSIYAIESGEVGSLGVQIIAMNYAKMFEKEGIEVTFVRAKISPEKNLGNAYEPLSDAAKEKWQARVDRTGELFLSAVASGRGKSTEYALEHFGKGSMLDATQAMKVGLIDGIATLEDLLSTKTEPKKDSARYKALVNRV